MIRIAATTLTVCALLVLFAFGLDWTLETAIYKGAIPHLDSWPGMRTLPLEARVAFGAAGILIPLMVLSLRLAQRALDQGIVVKGRNGDDVMLRPEAIERLVNNKIRAEVSTVTGVRTRAEQGTNGPKLRLDLWLTDREDVSAVQRRVKEVATAAVQGAMGRMDPAEIRVLVHKVASTARPGGRPRRRRPEPRRSDVGEE